MQIDYSDYEKEQAIRLAIVQSLAFACHPDHLKKTKCLVRKLEKHMRYKIKRIEKVELSKDSKS